MLLGQEPFRRALSNPGVRHLDYDAEQEKGIASVLHSIGILLYIIRYDHDHAVQ